MSKRGLNAIVEHLNGLVACPERYFLIMRNAQLLKLVIMILKCNVHMLNMPKDMDLLFHLVRHMIRKRKDALSQESNTSKKTFYHFAIFAIKYKKEIVS